MPTSISTDRFGHREHPRHGFTAIELMVVLSVAIMLGTLAIGAVLPSLRRGRVAQAVETIGELSNDARRYARIHADTGRPGRWYGVKLGGDASPNYVALMHGDEEVMRKALNPTVQIYDGDYPLTGTKQWWYQHATGFPLDTVTGRPTGVGVGAVGSGDHLSIRTLDQQIRTAVAIYAIGVINAQDF